MLIRFSSGPIPSPEDLERYEKARPGTADDIVEMAKEERRIKKFAIRAASFREATKDVLAFLFAGAVLGMIAYSLFLGEPITAVVQ